MMHYNRRDAAIVLNSRRNLKCNAPTVRDGLSIIPPRECRRNFKSWSKYGASTSTRWVEILIMMSVEDVILLERDFKCKHDVHWRISGGCSRIQTQTLLRRLTDDHKSALLWCLHHHQSVHPGSTQWYTSQDANDVYLCIWGIQSGGPSHRIHP